MIIIGSLTPSLHSLRVAAMTANRTKYYDAQCLRNDDRLSDVTKDLSSSMMYAVSACQPNIRERSFGAYMLKTVCKKR